jgi:hypothetical protein
MSISREITPPTYLEPITGHLLVMSSTISTVLRDVSIAERCRSSARSQMSRSSSDMLQVLRFIIWCVRTILKPKVISAYPRGNTRTETRYCEQLDVELSLCVATKRQSCLLISRPWSDSSWCEIDSSAFGIPAVIRVEHN